jgi:hypothetical protein
MAIGFRGLYRTIAEGQGWITNGVKKGWMTITRSGERAARLYVVGL